MVKYENYRMRVVEIKYKELDYDMDKVLIHTRYKIQEKWSWFFGWEYIAYEPGFDDFDYVDYYGFTELEACMKYMKERMKRWKRQLDADEVDKAEERLLRKIEKKHRKELKPTRRVVCEMNLLDLEK